MLMKPLYRKISRVGRFLPVMLIVTLAGALLGVARPTRALPSVALLSIEMITWNIIGLDSNNVNVGPNEFPVAARVCNDGLDAATNVNATFVWDENPSPNHINLSGASTLSTPVIEPNDCYDFYFNVVITRDQAAYHFTRDFHIEVTADNASPVSSPQPRELYVEQLLSQSRNDVITISGPSTVYIGETYTFTMTSKTATNGYEQIESFLNFPNTMFEIVEVQTTYTAYPAGRSATIDKVYGDGCGWVNDPNSPEYRSCTGTGKYGGDLLTVYTVRILDLGQATVTNLIYDFSGSSYHYNADFGSSPDNVLAITAVSPLSAQKSSTLLVDADGNGAASPGDTLRYTVNLENLGSSADITGVVYDDTPDPNTTLLNGSVTTTQGTVTLGNTAGDTSLSVDVGTLAPGQIVTIVYDVTINNPLPSGTTEVVNQGIATSNELPPAYTDDPNTAQGGDATVVPVVVPTAIGLTRFEVVPQGQDAVVQWSTSAEVNTWGFLIYRSVDGSRENAVQVTPQVVPSQGRNGGSYSWTDTTTEPGQTYTYWLREVEVNGSVVEYGPRTLTLPSVLDKYSVYMPHVVSQ